MYDGNWFDNQLFCSLTTILYRNDYVSPGEKEGERAEVYVCLLIVEATCNYCKSPSHPLFLFHIKWHVWGQGTLHICALSPHILHFAL